MNQKKYLVRGLFGSICTLLSGVQKWQSFYSNYIRDL